MKLSLLSGVVLLLLMSFDKEGCILGNIEYTMADYSLEVFIKKEYQRTFDSLLHDPVEGFFCNETIKNLPTLNKNKEGNLNPSQKYIIEPLFVDLSTFNGLYSKRMYSTDKKIKTPKYRCGFYHYTFLISENTYIPLTSDTVKNEKLIKEHLKSNFSKDELLRMVKYYKYQRICDQYTFFPPSLIKKKNGVIFDVETVSDK